MRASRRIYSPKCHNGEAVNLIDFKNFNSEKINHKSRNLKCDDANESFRSLISECLSMHS